MQKYNKCRLIHWGRLITMYEMTCVLATVQLIMYLYFVTSQKFPSTVPDTRVESVFRLCQSHVISLSLLLYFTPLLSLSVAHIFSYI